jgi:Type II secretion system (T2SS), protein E, N-terminal domain
MPLSLPSIAASADSVGNAQPRPLTLTDMLSAMKVLRSQPVISLATAIEQLELLDHETLERLRREDPDLLRSKSSELVRRALMTPEALEHALAITAGIVEINAEKFSKATEIFNLLPLHTLRSLDFLMLGEDNGLLFVATWCPTNEDMHSRLCALVGRNLIMVWGTAHPSPHG